LTSGYSEVHIQAFLLIVIYALAHGEYKLGGLAAAALLWANDMSLIIYAIFFVIAAVTLRSYRKDSVTSVGVFLTTWIAGISPWVIYKWYHALGDGYLGTQNFGYIDGALGLFAKCLFNHGSAGIFWIGILLGFLYLLIMRRDSIKNLSLIFCGLMLIVLNLILYTSTDAYDLMINQNTIHRSLLQIAPVVAIALMINLGQAERLHDTVDES